MSLKTQYLGGLKFINIIVNSKRKKGNYNINRLFFIINIYVKEILF